MHETRAFAHLPKLDVEITHRRLEEEQAETLTVSLRAEPSFAAFARFAESQLPLWTALALGPWRAWMAMSQAALALNPLLARPSSAPRAQAEEPATPAPARRSGNVVPINDNRSRG